MSQLPSYIPILTKKDKKRAELIPVTGREFRHFVKNEKDKPNIVCVCFEPMEYVGQHNYKNMNYYLLRCKTCTCQNKLMPIPYLDPKFSYYAADPAFMRIDHNHELVTSSMGNGVMISIPKMKLVMEMEPVYRIVQKNGYMCSEPLNDNELLKYYEKHNLDEQEDKEIEFDFS